MTAGRQPQQPSVEPPPTVVVIGSDRRVHFAEVSPDWLVRSEAQPIIDALDALLGDNERIAKTA